MRRNAKNILSWFLFLSGVLITNASSGQELNVPVRNYTPTEWKSTWVTNPDLSGNEYAVVLFRSTFDLPEVPSNRIISISTDNKYTFSSTARKFTSDRSCRTSDIGDMKPSIF